MKVWAHRGTNVEAYENTIEAFNKAVECNPYGIELDVRLCASGEVIVFHDPTLWNQTRSFEVVSNISLSKIRKLLPYYVPTFDEFLEEFYNKSRFCVNTKGSKVRSVELESSIVKSLSGLDVSRYEFSSKDFLSLAKLYSLSDTKPEITLNLGNPKKLKLAHRFVKIDSVIISNMFVRPRWGASEAEARSVMSEGIGTIRRLRRKGYNVRVETVNNPIRAQDLALMGANAISTDHVARILRKPIGCQS